MHQIRSRIRLFAGMGLLLLAGCGGDTHDTPPATKFVLTPDVIEQHDRGVGLMGQFKYGEAHEVFSELAAQYSDWFDVKIDLAIAKLNRREANDVEDSQALLDEVIAAHPEKLRAKYCRAILLLYAAEPERALQLFKDVAEADPSDAYAIYYAGQSLLDTRQYGPALDYFQRAQSADPYLRSAYYGAFQALQRLDRKNDAKAALEMFQKLADNPQARSAEVKYSRMGSKAEAQTVQMTSNSQQATPPTGPLFQPLATLPVGGEAEWAPGSDNASPPSTTACDIDGDGQLDLFVASGVQMKTADFASGEFASAVLRRDGTAWQLQPDHGLAQVTQVNAALWGDFDNDGLVDAYLCRRGPNQLWRQSQPTEWEDVTDGTQTSGGDLNTVDGAMFDADHDGDLDLFLVNADGPNELFNNNLDGTFRPLAASQGIAGASDASAGIVVADLDNDRDADVVVINQQPPHEVFINDRLWNYSQVDGWETFCNSNVMSAVAADTDADGQVELVTSSADGFQQWSRGEDGQWAATELDCGAQTPAAGPLAVQDIDGDGRLDLVATSPEGWFVADCFGESSSVMYSADQANLGHWALVNEMAGRGYSMVAPAAGVAPSVWVPGTGRYEFADVRFTGQENKADQMRSNLSGIGIRAAARVGGQWTSLQTFRDQSSAGQSRQPIPVGLHGRRAIDFVELLWPDGLFQTELGLVAGQSHQIEETQRQVSSCPVLFVWDGEQHRFVSDVLGVGGLGFNHGRGVYHQPRPWENLILPADLPVATERGTFRMKIGEPMEEACYLDALRLVSYELPPGWFMTMDERQSVSEPFATGDPIYFRETLLPSAAVDADGQNVLQLLRDADGQPLPTGARDRRFLARTEPFSVALTFDKPLTNLTGRPVLVIDGWVEYPYSQTMFAAWQANANYDTPTLEARSPDGDWQVVYKDFGYPAGMPRQMSLPLNPADLPAGATQLRIRTNMEVYWDRMFIAIQESCDAVVRVELPMLRASVQEVGFPFRTNTAYRKPAFDYGNRVPLWDTRHQPGFYTNFGEATPLVTHADDAVAIIGPGEEMEFEFSASDESAATKGTRVYVLECHGWCKDMDLYTEHGEGIDPLPRRAGVDSSDADETKRRELLNRFNTRYRAG